MGPDRSAIRQSRAALPQTVRVPSRSDLGGRDVGDLGEHVGVGGDLGGGRQRVPRRPPSTSCEVQPVAAQQLGDAFGCGDDLTEPGDESRVERRLDPHRSVVLERDQHEPGAERGRVE